MGNFKSLREFSVGGVILFIKEKDKQNDYIVLVKRTDNPGIANPGKRSSFFGYTDDKHKEEKLNFRITSYRELLEELLIIPKNRNEVYGIVIPNFNYKKYKFLKTPKKYIKELFTFWKIKDKKDKNNKIKQNNPQCRPLIAIGEKRIIFSDNRKITGTLVLRVKIPVLFHSCIFLDGEEDKKRGKLLDRRIDLIEKEKFKRWWLTDKKSFIAPNFSYQRAEQVGTESFRRNKISPTLKRALNKLWKK